MNSQKTKLLFFAVGLVSVFFIVLIIIFITSSNQNRSPGLQSPTPAETNTADTEILDLHEEDTPIDPDPTYTELLTEQPFWDLLPYRQESFLIERIMHNNTIRITTLDPGAANPNRQQLIESYRSLALNWLTNNGAFLGDLTIEYVPQE